MAVCGIKYKYCDCFLEYTNFKDDLTECKCLCCNKSSQRKFDKILKDLFFNTNKFSNHNNNQFILLLQKGVYPNEYMDDWGKFNETLPEKEDFYGHLNVEDITDADYTNAKRVCKVFDIKSLGEYHDFYVQSDTLFLAGVFGNFRNMSSNTWARSCTFFFSTPGLAWQTTL